MQMYLQNQLKLKGWFLNRRAKIPDLIYLKPFLMEGLFLCNFSGQ